MESCPSSQPAHATRLQEAPGGLIITDSRGVVVYANRAVERRTGFSLPEIIGKTPGALWGGRMKRRFYDELWETIVQRKLPFFATVENETKSGTIYQERMRLAPVANESGEPVYFIAAYPAARSSLEQNIFEQEFRMLFSRSSAAQPSQSFVWLLRELARGATSEAPAADLSIARSAPNASLAELLALHLVRPMTERFAYRESDAALVRAAQQDQEQFAALYRRHQASIASFFLRRTGNAETAADLTQDTFLNAFRHLPAFQSGNASYRTYLLRIAHNLLVNFYRKERPQVSLDDDGADAPEPATARGAPEASADEAAFWRLVEAALSPVDAQILRRRYQNRDSVRDIARSLGKSDNAVKLHLSRSRKKLRQQLR